MEPKKIKYSIAPTPFEVKWIAENSPKKAPTKDKPNPPASICIAMLGIIDEEALKLLEYTEPAAQEKAPASNNKIPIISVDVLLEFGITKRATPPKPINRPSQPFILSLGLFGKTSSISAIKSGTVATIKDAIPECIRVSAQTTHPFPPNKRNKPTTEIFITSERLTGSFNPLYTENASIKEPATRNLIPANMVGGNSPTPIRIAK